MIIDHLRAHFSVAQVIERVPLQVLQWQPTPTRQGLLIEQLDRWVPGQAGMRPALLTRRMGYQPFSLGINHEYLGSATRDGSRLFEIGVQGSIVIFCIADEAGVCELLAEETFTQLLGFGPILREIAPGMLRCGIGDVGVMQPVVESRGHFGIPVTFAFAHTYSWRVTQAGRVLQHVDTGGLRTTPPGA